MVAKASGTIRDTSVVACGLFVFRSARSSAQPAGNPPRRAGNFHLRAQMKVTNAKGLNTSDHVYFPYDQTVGRRPNAPPPCPAWCLRTPSPRNDLHLARRVWSVSPVGRCEGTAAHHTASGYARRHSGWHLIRIGTECLARRTRPCWSDGGDAAPRVLEGSGRAGRRRAWPSTDSLVEREVNQVAGVEAVCFGDFHLGPQMKVTRPPGRIPGRLSRESR